MDWGRWNRELEQRREDVRNELKKGLKDSDKNKNDIDVLIDKSWDELLTVIDGYRDSSVTVEKLQAAIPARVEEEEELEELECVEDLEEAESVEELEAVEEEEIPFPDNLEIASPFKTMFSEIKGTNKVEEKSENQPTALSANESESED
jgi:hypothetical protein